MALVLVPVILALGFSAQAQDCNYTLSGYILDEHDQTPLEYASIFIRELGTGANADQNGFYAIDRLCAGVYSLLIRHVGCEPREEQINIEGDLKKTFVLEHHTLELHEVVVAGKSERRELSLASSQLGEDDVFTSQGKSLAESLKSLSGVNSLQSGPTISKPVIHGLHSNRILVVNNGIRQEGQQWGREHAPELDPSAATQFTVVKGAASVRYGADAMGGVILVEPSALPNRQQLDGRVNLVGQSNNCQGTVSTMLQGGFDNGIGWRLQGTVKRGGDARAAEYRLSNTGVGETNFSGAFGYNKEDKGIEIHYSRFESGIAILRSAHVGNLSDLINAIKSDVPLYVEDFTYKIDNPRQEVRHDLVKLNGRLKMGQLGEAGLQYGFQLNGRREYDRRRGSNFNVPSISLDIFTHTIDMVLDQNPTGNLMGQFGISGIFQRNQNNAGTNASFLIPDFKTWGIGGFVTEKFVREDWELEGGIRYDFRILNPLVFNASNELLTTKYHFNNITVSFGGIVDLGELFELKANISSAWRPPHISELFSNGLHHGAASIERGIFYQEAQLAENFEDAELPSEQAVKEVVTLEYKGGKLRAEASVHHNIIRNYMYLRPNGVELSIRGEFPVFQYTRTNARFMGMDGIVNYQITDHWSYTGKYSLLYAKDLSANDVLINVPSNSFRNELGYEVLDKLGMGKLYFTLEAQTVLRQGRAPQEFNDFQNADPPATIYDFKEAPKGYTLLNFRSGVEIDNFRIGFSVENLFNISYRDYMNRFRYFADDLGSNFSIRLQYTFKQEIKK